ncbi:hypothetical protein ACFL96_19100, partial [Thermoproteota archaeon]
MAHLVYDFNKLAEKYKWAQDEKLLPFHITEKIRLLIHALVMKGIPLARVEQAIDAQGKKKQHSVTHCTRDWDKHREPYLELDADNKILKVRRLTYKGAEYEKMVDDTADNIFKLSSDVVQMIPCNYCQKRMHTGSDGLCLDCMDELGIGVYHPDWGESFHKAKPFLNTFLMAHLNVGSVGMELT